ncbi:MAG: substrate-binding domain-containing protein, partial [Lachnospiraceae bacterium]|nr:substrate-binding domain-containing protein [Lachnospiraceae bacterium]
MKKQIAVLMCAISFDNQRKILEGIMEQAKAHDIKIFVFTCFINYNEVNVEKQGAFHIMEMPDYKLYDGIIVVKNTIQYSGIADYVIQKVRESGVPAVCIDEEVEGMHYVGISDYQSMRMVVEHVVKDHQKRKVCYVTGRVNNKEGTERLRAYEDTMREAVLPYDKEDIFCGDYALESGRRAAVYYIRERGIVPEAIICANDSMAIGVCSQLELMGYRVPEDIIVTGFDGDELAYCNLPPITTVNRNQFRLGFEAVDILMHADSMEQYQKRIVSTSMAVGNSCGCQETVPLDVDELRRTYVSKTYILQQSVDAIKNMSSDFASVSTPDELAEALKKYVEMTDMQCFYLCLGSYDEIFRWKEKNLDGKIKQAEPSMTYTDEVKVVLAYEEGEFKEYGNINRQDIIPPACRNGMKSDIFVVAPVFYQKLCYGYCVSCNSEFPLRSELFYSWVMNIGIGLENIRKQVLLQETVKELNSMWVYDMLTHLYNRAGFYHYAEPMLE